MKTICINTFFIMLSISMAAVNAENQRRQYHAAPQMQSVPGVRTANYIAQADAPAPALEPESRNAPPPAPPIPAPKSVLEAISTHIDGDPIVPVGHPVKLELITKGISVKVLKWSVDPANAMVGFQRDLGDKKQAFTMVVPPNKSMPVTFHCVVAGYDANNNLVVDSASFKSVIFNGQPPKSDLPPEGPQPGAAETIPDIILRLSDAVDSPSKAADLAVIADAAEQLGADVRAGTARIRGDYWIQAKSQMTLRLGVRAPSWSKWFKEMDKLVAQLRGEENRLKIDADYVEFFTNLAITCREAAK